MRRSIATVLVLIFSVIFLGAHAWADGEPPDVEKGWSLISAMCDLTTGELRETLTDETAKVFKWNGTQYEEVDSLLRGYGYVLNSGKINGLASQCKKPMAAFNTTVEMKAGWNLLGNPFSRTLSIQEIMGASADSFSDIIYEYDGKTYKQITKDDKIKWGVSVWVYTSNDVTLTLPFECDNINITYDRMIYSIPIIGEQLPFSAYCTGEVDIEVTSIASWNIVPSTLLEPGDEPGVFVAAAAGTANVSASYESVESNTIQVEIIDPVVTLEHINFTINPTNITVGAVADIAAEAVYSDNSTKDITLDAAYSFSTLGMVSISERTLIALAEGSVTVTATYAEDGVEKTSQVPVNIDKDEAVNYVQVFISAFPQTMEIHEVANVNAYGITEAGVQEVITDKVEWTYDTGMGQFETSTGHFYPTAIGTVTFSAHLGSVQAAPRSIKIIQKQLIWVGIFPDSGDITPLPCPDYFGFYYCYTNHYMNVGDSGSFRAIADYNDHSSATITDSIEIWESANPDILSIDSGHVTANKTGLAAVRAYKEGVYSEWAWVQVIDTNTDEFLLLEYSNRETIVEVGDEPPLNATFYKRSASIIPPYQVFTNYITDGNFEAARVTNTAQWTVDDPQVGTFDTASGQFSGLAAGATDVSASYNELLSNSVLMEVWQPEEINFCDPDNPAEAQWTDNKTLVRLAVDCETYSTGDEVDIVFDALQSDYSGRRVLDVCLDLYIYNENHELVKTIRNENCSPTPLFRSMGGYTPIYNYGYQWDQTDENGDPAPAGNYTAVARFYVLYCPVLKVDFTIE